jgi:hypothetical protein
LKILRFVEGGQNDKGFHQCADYSIVKRKGQFQSSRARA